ncbi:MAG: CBS domain-containing protein, partial [Candidatus Desulforudis sp.]|nr:CBS domain-containing protein [Desulforudis sp.]
MPTEISVGEVMLPLARCHEVAAEEGMEKAVARLHQALADGHHSLLVHDRAGNHVGLLGVYTVLKLFEPEFIVTETWSMPVFWNEFSAIRAGELTRIQVREVMRPLDGVFAKTTDPLTKAVHLMLRHRLDTLPVLAGESLTGVLRVSDVLEQLGKLVGPDKAAEP